MADPDRPAPTRVSGRVHKTPESVESGSACQKVAAVDLLPVIAAHYALRARVHAAKTEGVHGKAADKIVGEGGGKGKGEDRDQDKNRDQDKDRDQDEDQDQNKDRDQDKDEDEDLAKVADSLGARRRGSTHAGNPDTSLVRAVNNFVKSCVIDITLRAAVLAANAAPITATAAISVADIACGRGQDFPKWMHAANSAGVRLDTFYGMDAADTRSHLHDMAQKYLVPIADCVYTCMGDMSTRFDGCADGSMDIVSAQLCLHYLCDDVARLETFFAECGRVLKRTGVLLVSYADGRAIVRRGRDALTEAPKPGYTVSVRGKHYAVDIPSLHLTAATASPWGAQYTFSLADSVCELPEFLCHEGSVCLVAQRAAGLLAGPSMCFDEAAAAFLAVPRYADIALKMRCLFGTDGRLFTSTTEKDHIFDTASLYRVAVFSRCSDSLRRWQTAFANPSVGGGETCRQYAHERTEKPCPSNPAPPQAHRLQVHKKPKLEI